MMRSYLAPAFAAGVCVLFAACGGSNPTSPSTTAPPASGSAPVLRLEIKIDDLGSRDAVVSLSEVSADLSGSAGSGALTYSIDFGDGFVASSATARHTYNTPGTFTLSASVTDAQSRKTTASRQIAVKSLTGSWFEAEYVQKTRRVEVRRLTLTAQDGVTVRGRYQVTGEADRIITGTLSAPRSIRLVMDGGATLDGTLPSRLNDEGENWILQARGDTVDGERLEFRPILGEPAAPPPDADMKVRFGDDAFSEPISAVTPVHIDGTSSRGSGLSYFIEFGDDFVATTSEATHVVDSDRTALVAQLTVLDRFGRTDAESVRYFPFVLNDTGDYWTSYRSTERRPDQLDLQFSRRRGANYEGTCTIQRDFRYGFCGRATATLTGQRDIRVVLPDLSIELRGYISVFSPFTFQMTLIQVGGADDGKTWVLNLASSY